MSSADDTSRGFTVDRRRRWPIFIGAAIVVIAIVVFVVVKATGSDDRKTFGSTIPFANYEGNPSLNEIVEYWARDVAPRYGLKVKLVGVDDSTELNRAISKGELAGTVSQHRPWLEQVKEENPSFRLTTGPEPVFRWNFGLFSLKHKRVEDIPDGATISLLADPANEAQGLWVLKQAGLIDFKPGVDPGAATRKDVVNPHRFKWELLDFGAQPRALKSIDGAIGATQTYAAAGIGADHLLFAPVPLDKFAAVVTIGQDFADDPSIEKVVESWSDPAIAKHIETNPVAKEGLVPWKASSGS